MKCRRQTDQIYSLQSTDYSLKFTNIETAICWLLRGQSCPNENKNSIKHFPYNSLHSILCTSLFINRFNCFFTLLQSQTAMCHPQELLKRTSPDHSSPLLDFLSFSPPWACRNRFLLLGLHQILMELLLTLTREYLYRMYVYLTYIWWFLQVVLYLVLSTSYYILYFVWCEQCISIQCICVCPLYDVLRILYNV